MLLVIWILLYSAPRRGNAVRVRAGGSQRGVGRQKVGAGGSGYNAKGYSSGIAGARNWSAGRSYGELRDGRLSRDGVEVGQRADVGCFETVAAQSERAGRSWEMPGGRKEKAGREGISGNKAGAYNGPKEQRARQERCCSPAATLNLVEGYNVAGIRTWDAGILTSGIGGERATRGAD